MVEEPDEVALHAPVSPGILPLSSSKLRQDKVGRRKMRGYYSGGGVREEKCMRMFRKPVRSVIVAAGLMFATLGIFASQVARSQKNANNTKATDTPTSERKAKADAYSVVRLDLPNVSSGMWESHPAIDPQTGDLWFVRSDTTFSGWRIFVSRCQNGTLQSPVASPFGSVGIEADPFFSKDGKDLYYISSRTSGSKLSNDLDIWHVRRKPNGEWLAPEKLPSPVNSSFAEWFPRPASDGWLYFGSRRPGGYGRDDIWRAHVKPDGTWAVENAGAGINTAGAEYEFLPAADGTWGILSTDRGLYRVDRGPKGWIRGSRMGEEVNVNGTEIGPMWVGANGSFLFSRDAGAAKSGELFIASRENRAVSPGACSSLEAAIGGHASLK